MVFFSHSGIHLLTDIAAAFSCVLLLVLIKNVANHAAVICLLVLIKNFGNHAAVMCISYRSEMRADVHVQNRVSL